MNSSARPREGGPVADGRPRPALPFAFVLAGAAGAAGAVILRLASDHGGPEPGLQAALLDWIALSYLVSGLVAWWRRPESRFGPLMVGAGFVVLLTTLSSANSPLLFTIGEALDLVPVAVFLHVFLAFPDGRLTGLPERLLVGATYGVSVGAQLVVLMLGGFGPDNLIALWSRPDLAAALFELQLALLAALALGGLAILLVRRRATGRPLRRRTSLLVSSFCVALVMIAAMLAMGAFTDWPAFVTLQRATFFVIGLAPIAFLLGLLDARLARASVGELLVELRANPAPGELRDPLARALRDPSLVLAYWLPQYASWTDESGRPLALPGLDDGRATTLVERDGAPLAALVHDPSLNDEPELVDAISAAAGIALENGRLHAELNARLEELQGSRERVIEVGQKERKRLERNLHDGAQQRLIALSLELGLLAGELEGDPGARARVEQARREIGVSLEELRHVARGLHPAVLSGHGLRVALESQVATSAVPAELSVAVQGRLAEPIEVAAFYVVSESLANVAKHARASSATVDVAQSNGELVVEVVDDGIGGADSERGSGLRGLADRVEALGGRLRVWTPAGGGTRVRAELPCG